MQSTFLLQPQRLLRPLQSILIFPQYFYSLFQGMLECKFTLNCIIILVMHSLAFELEASQPPQRDSNKHSAIVMFH